MQLPLTDDSLLALSARVVAAARGLGLSVSIPHAAYLLLVLPPAAAAAAAAPGGGDAAPLFRFSAAAAATTATATATAAAVEAELPAEEAEAAVAAAVLLLQRQAADPVAAALRLQVTWEGALLDSAAAVALQQTRHNQAAQEAADLVVHADHSRLRDVNFVCWLREQLLAYCVAALPCLAAAANPAAAAAAAAKASAAAAADAAAAAAAAKAAAVLQLVEDALDAAQPITKLPCLFSLPVGRRMQHLEELKCIVMASLLLQQRQPATAAAAGTAAATAANDAFVWLATPTQLAEQLAAEEQQLLQQQALHAQDGLQRIRNIFSISQQQREAIGVDAKLARVVAAESVFLVQQIRFLQALLVQQQQRRAAAAAAAAACEQHLAAVEACLQQRHGQAHPDLVYGRLAAAGAAYLQVYREQQVLQQLVKLRLLLQQQAAALHAPDTTKLDAAALRIRRKAGSTQQQPHPLDTSSSSSGMRIFGAAETEGDEARAALGGYCLHALLEDGVLIPGDPHAGGVELGGERFLFSCRTRLLAFLQQQQQQQHVQPELLLQQQLACVVRSNPALIFTLGLEDRFPEPNLKAILTWAYKQELQHLKQQQQQKQQDKGWVGSCRLELCVRLSEGKGADAATDTDDLLQQTAQQRSSSSSSSDEWELRRQALQQARLCSCLTRSTQTALSSFFRDAETQQEESTETATNTDAAAATVGPRSSRHLLGLRGSAAKTNQPLQSITLRLKL
ncbi:hypothetical protein Efla_007283 [Eimeria flavescens]